MSGNNIEQLNSLINDYFEKEDKQSPTSASALGIHKYDHELEDFSEDNQKKMKNSLNEHYRALKKIDFEDLDTDNRIKYHLLNERIKSSYQFFEETRNLQVDPALYAEVAINSVFLLTLRNYAPLEDRLKAAASRMKKLPAFFDTAKKNLENPPRIFTTVASEMLQGAGAFFKGLIPKMAEETPSIKNDILLASDVALAAVRDYQKFIVEDLSRRSDGDFAIGKKLMDKMLTETEFLNYDSDQLWKKGEEELEKCEQEVEKFVKKNFDAHKPWREVYKEVKKNHPAADKVLQTYVEYLEKARKFVEKHDIVEIPANQKLVAMDTPEFNRSLTPFAAMMPPAPYEEDQTSYLWVTPVDPSQSAQNQERQLRDSSYGKIQYVSLHEAYPGHHLQLVYSNRIKDPMFCRTFSNIFIEGWAFYCEQLMKELGYFDKEGELCQLEAAYWRALRILLDVGLHTRRFDFDGAMEFLQSKVDWSPFIAEGELKRYTRTPTQALSYYTGKLELFNIKRGYEKQKKDSFSLRQFHEDLLNCGSLPPKLIEWKLGLKEVEKPKLR
ncbi:MAG: DUF885 domain-containing protein [Vulcanimicrobiota bacterium]